MPSLRTYDSNSDGERSSMPLVKNTGQKRTGGKRKPKKPLAITDGHGDDVGNDSMPELQTVSDSSGENDEDIHVSENDEEENDYDDESGYDSEEDEVHRTMEREAMDATMAIPEFFDPKSTVPDFDALVEERKGNPFLKLLGSLRGEMIIHCVAEVHKLIYPQGVCFPPTRSSARPHVLNHERAPSGRTGRLPKLRLSRPLFLHQVQRCLTFLIVKFPPRSPYRARSAHLVRRKR